MVAYVLYNHRSRKKLLHFYADEHEGLAAQAIAAVKRTHDHQISPERILEVKIIHEVSGVDESKYSVTCLNQGFKLEQELAETGVTRHRKQPITDSNALLNTEVDELWDRGLERIKQTIKRFRGR